MLFTHRRSLGDDQARPLGTPVESEFELQTVFSTLSPSFDRSDHRNEAPIRPAWKRSLFHLLEDPSSSAAAFLVYILTTSLILTSALVTIFETVPYFHSISPSVWFGIETSLVALFTIEYIARTVAWSTTWQSYLGWALCMFNSLSCSWPIYHPHTTSPITHHRPRFTMNSLLRHCRPSGNFTILHRDSTPS